MSWVSSVKTVGNFDPIQVLSFLSKELAKVISQEKNVNKGQNFQPYKSRRKGFLVVVVVVVVVVVTVVVFLWFCLHLFEFFFFTLLTTFLFLFLLTFRFLVPKGISLMNSFFLGFLLCDSVVVGGFDVVVAAVGKYLSTDGPGLL